MFDSISQVRFERLAFLSSCANLRVARRGAALVPVLLLQLAAAHATPFGPSAGCVPTPYTTGDLTCTNTGTINVTGADGIDAPANNGNATTTNSGSVNVNAGNSGGIFGIWTTTDIGQATTNNSGASLSPAPAPILASSHRRPSRQVLSSAPTPCPRPAATPPRRTTRVASTSPAPGRHPHDDGDRAGDLARLRGRHLRDRKRHHDELRQCRLTAPYRRLS